MHWIRDSGFEGDCVFAVPQVLGPRSSWLPHNSDVLNGLFWLICTMQEPRLGQSREGSPLGAQALEPLENGLA